MLDYTPVGVGEDEQRIVRLVVLSGRVGEGRAGAAAVGAQHPKLHGQRFGRKVAEVG